jgi:hypothetical protein
MTACRFWSLGFCSAAGLVIGILDFGLDQCLLAVAVLALAARFLLLLHLSPKTREVDLKEVAKLVCIYMRK